MPFRQGVSLIDGCTPVNGARWWIMRARDSSNSHAHRRSRAAVRHRKSSRGRSLSASSGMRIAESHALLFQSKLLLLNSANHSYRRTRTRKDLKRVEHFRSELKRSEAALPRRGLGEPALENGHFWHQSHADLIEGTAASLDPMR